jgi:hypothetical protein
MWYSFRYWKKEYENNQSQNSVSRFCHKRVLNWQFTTVLFWGVTNTNNELIWFVLFANKKGKFSFQQQWENFQTLRVFFILVNYCDPSNCFVCLAKHYWKKLICCCLQPNLKSKKNQRDRIEWKLGFWLISFVDASSNSDNQSSEYSIWKKWIYSFEDPPYSVLLNSHQRWCTSE